MLHPRLWRVQARRRQKKTVCVVRWWGVGVGWGGGGGVKGLAVEMGHSRMAAYLRHSACKLFMGTDVGCYALHDERKKVRDGFF